VINIDKPIIELNENIIIEENSVYSTNDYYSDVNDETYDL